MPMGKLTLSHRNYLLLAILLFSSGSFGGTGQASTDPLTLSQEPDQVPYGPGSSWVVGHQLFTEGNIKDALPFLHAAYRSGPQVPVIALEFGAALQAQGYFDDALGVLDALVGEFPDSTRYRFQRAKLEARLGKTKPALDDLRQLRSLASVEPEVVSLEASILSGAGKVDEAMATLRAGLTMFPARGVAIYLGMSSVLEQNQQEAEIPAVLTEGIGQYPQSSTLHLELIRTLAGLGQAQDALAAAAAADLRFHLPHFSADTDSAAPPEVAAPGDPNDPLPGSFRVELADFYAQKGDVPRALKILQTLAASDQLDLEPSLWLARMLLGNDQVPAGTDLVHKLLKRWPDSGRGWFLLGKIAELNKDSDGVLTALRRAVALAPYDPEIRLNLVRTLLLNADGRLQQVDPDSTTKSMQDDFRQQVAAATTLVPDKDHGGQLVLGFALRLLGQAERAAWHFQLAAEDPELRMNALLQGSLSWDEAGDFNKARSLLELLRQENPDNPEIANSLGYFLAEKDKELDEAQRLVEEALSADPSNGAYLDSMGWVKFRRGEIDQALDFLVRAVNAIPDDPVILEHLGAVLSDQGRSAEARDLFQRALLLGGDKERLQNRLQDLE